jgi:hypothetical protein
MKAVAQMLVSTFSLTGRCGTTYSRYGNGREREWVANDVTHVHALAAILNPGVFHFPERGRMKRTVHEHQRQRCQRVVVVGFQVAEEDPSAVSKW